MCLHRLLQRGYAQLYGYTLPPPTQSSDLLKRQECSDDLAVQCSDYATAALVAANMAELNFKMKGVRFLSVNLECIFS